MVAVAIAITAAGSTAVAAADLEKKVVTSLRFETSLTTADVAIAVQPFSAWAKSVIERSEKILLGSSVPRYAIVQVRMHPSQDARILVAAEPAFAAREAEALQQAATSPQPPRPSRVEVTVSFHYQFAGAARAPELPSPDVLWGRQFTAAATRERWQMLRAWARTQILPTIAAYAERAEPRFEGVRAMAKVFDLASRDAGAARIEVERLTDRNSDYWRSVMEMTRGNPLTVTGRIFMDVANGDLDRARVWTDLTLPFSERETVPRTMLEALSSLSKLVFDDINARIGEGIKRYERSDVKAAAAIFEGVLKDYPCASWAHHELALSWLKLRDEARFQAAQRAVFDCNPVYPHQVQAQTGVEAYRLSRRLQLRKLFQAADPRAEDFATFADIALDLDQHALASHVLWQTLRLGKDDAAIDARLALFLYGLEQLGVTTIKANFRGDHAKAFSAIEARRKQALESSPEFRAMQKPR